MTHPNAIIVSDAHLGQAPERTTESFHRFLREIPDRTRHLIINGDLFEFWFEYPDVIPRKAFRTLSHIRQVVDAGVQVTVLGGNHDRWGRDFWSDELGATFYRDGASMDVAGWKAWIHHGDGLIESDRGARWLHRFTRMPITESTFRAVHPNLGFKIIRKLSSDLADQKRTEEEKQQLAKGQLDFAKGLMEKESDLELVILAHTHRAILERFSDRKCFLNPGAWFEDGAYAEVTPSDVKLLQYNSLSGTT